MQSLARELSRSWVAVRNVIYVGPTSPNIYNVAESTAFRKKLKTSFFYFAVDGISFY